MEPWLSGKEVLRMEYISDAKSVIEFSAAVITILTFAFSCFKYVSKHVRNKDDQKADCLKQKNRQLPDKND